jgi:hypothetical protein
LRLDRQPVRGRLRDLRGGPGGSPAGGPVAGLFAYFAHQKGDVTQRNLELTAVAVALIVVILISFLPGTWISCCPGST